MCVRIHALYYLVGPDESMMPTIAILRFSCYIHILFVGMIVPKADRPTQPRMGNMEPSAVVVVVVVVRVSPLITGFHGQDIPFPTKYLRAHFVRQEQARMKRTKILRSNMVRHRNTVIGMTLVKM